MKTVAEAHGDWEFTTALDKNSTMLLAFSAWTSHRLPVIGTGRSPFC